PRRSPVVQLSVRAADPVADTELKLQRPGQLAQPQVHSWPELAIDDLSVAWELGLPTCRVVAAKVVDVSGRALFAFDNRLRVAPEESQGEGDSFSRRLLYCGRSDSGRRDTRVPCAERGRSLDEREHDLIAREIEAVASAL